MGILPMGFGFYNHGRDARATPEKWHGHLAHGVEVFKVAWASCPWCFFIITGGTPVPRRKSGMGILPKGLREWIEPLNSRSILRGRGELGLGVTK